MPTKIEWATETWNPVTGCTPVSIGCQNCYAKRMATRLRGRYGYPQDDPFKVTLHPERVDEYVDLPNNHPYRWRKPRMIFCCSMGDFFHPQVPLEFQARILNVMVKCPQHIFLILTKREKQLATFNYACGWSSESYPNIWLGVTAENQEQADKRIPILLQIPAAVRWVSIEPMLGAIDLQRIDGAAIDPEYKGLHLNALTGGCKSPTPWHLDWVVCGGETGPWARPMLGEWAFPVKEQCVAASVPFFFKGWGTARIKKIMPTYRLLDGRTWGQLPGREA